MSYTVIFQDGVEATYVNADAAIYRDELIAGSSGLNLPFTAEMPSLLYPGRKPTGNVKIDWSNSLTDNLTGFYLLDERRYKHNLVTGKNGVTEFGTGVELFANHIKTTGTSDNYIDIDTGLTPGGEITVFAGIKFISGSVSFSILSRDTGWNGVYGEENTVKSVDSLNFNGSIVDTYPTIRCNISNMAFSLKNNKLTGAYSSNLVNDFIVTVPLGGRTNCALGLSKDDSSPDNPCIANFSYIGFIDKSVIDSVLLKLIEEPFSFLIPE